ncbi:Phytochrome A type 5 [Bienertia sinuspersici]
MKSGSPLCGTGSQGENVQVDALSRLASSTLRDLKRSMFAELLSRRSTETNREYVYQTVEAAIKQILNSLQKRLEDKKGKFLFALHGTLWSLRTTHRESTWQTPFHLVYGTEALMPGAENEKVMAERLDLVEVVREKVALKIQTYLGKVTRHYNRRVKTRVLQVGDLVLRKATVVQKARIHGKLASTWEGPY